MPWKECHAVDERTRFVRRLVEGETMTALCQEFGISRKDRLQDLPAVSADRRARSHRPEPSAVSARESAPGGRRNPHRAAETGPPDVGRAQDPRALAPAVGEKYEVDEAATDRRAERLPLPATVQQQLSMRLHPGC